MITTRVVSGSSSTVGVFSRMIDSDGSSGGLHIRHIFGPARAIVNQGPSHRHVNGHNSSAGSAKDDFPLARVYDPTHAQRTQNGTRLRFASRNGGRVFHLPDYWLFSDSLG